MNFEASLVVRYFMLRAKKLMTWSTLLITAVFLTGCVSPGNGSLQSTPPLGVRDTDQASVINEVPSSDLLEPGNPITISFSGLSTVPLPFTCRIREDGTITPPYLDKQIKAAGKTIGALEQELEKAYVPKIYRTINVTIRTAERFYFVGGEVRQPSRQPYIGRITVSQAIQSVGDFTDFADKRKVRIFRSNNKVQIVDCKAALEDPTKDVLIYPGDRIVVDSKLF
ncbi:MAG: polysaccharide biosynthesis/export family protein [Verrucomicrobiota bacterium]|nr:polysaccharide biosynthesis/export family protein [Verrucomicrobiota bacterium]